MRLAGSHRRWIVARLALLVVATLAYAVYAVRALHGPRGGSWPGLAYGAAGLALMLYAGALGLRRRVPTWRVGRRDVDEGTPMARARHYALILFHAGFQLGGPLTLSLMVLFTAAVAGDRVRADRLRRPSAA
jgi:predicted cobalt transporter CbtA